MKRSEILKAISEVITTNTESYVSDLQAETILTMLENVGMLPPQIKNPEVPKAMSVYEFSTNKALDKLYSRNGITSKIQNYYINEWEPEE